MSALVPDNMARLRIHRDRYDSQPSLTEKCEESNRVQKYKDTLYKYWKGRGVGSVSDSLQPYEL